MILPLLGSLVPQDLFLYHDKSRFATITLPEIIIKSAGNLSPLQQQIFLNWGALGYLFVTIAMLAGLVLSIIKIVRFYLAAKRAQKINDNIYLYPGHISPFSFLGRIYISHHYINHPGLNSILIHENAHIRQHHIIDLVLMELLSSLFWFNPFFFLIKKALREVHEYLADREVVKNGAEPLKYQQLLFNEVAGHPQYIIANNFNLLTKKRIIMLIKKSGKNAALRIGVFMPVVLVAAFVLTSIQVNSLMAQNSRQSKQVSEAPAAKVSVQEVMPPPPPPPPPAGKSALSSLASAPDGNAPPPPPPPPPPPSRAKQKSEAKFVSVPGDQEKEVFTMVEEMPKYPGGDEARTKYMIESIKYPAEAKKKGIEGTVYVSFIVESDGTVSNVKILKGIGGGCDEEAMRVVKGMPKWLPGKQKGKPVRVQFNMPVKYAFDKKDKTKEQIK